MHTFIYISEATKDFSIEDLEELLDVASRLNGKNGITGYLHYEGGYFLQYIEGTADALSETVGRIERDPRHNIFYRAEESELDKRRFPGWYMKWLDRSDSREANSSIAALAESLEPLEDLEVNGALERVFSVYKQIVYDHVLRGIAELKSTNSELTDMMAMSVHDLKSPLRTIGMLIDAYVEDHDPPQELVDLTSQVSDRISRAETIVESMLAHFRSLSDDSFSKVNVADVVSEISDAIKLVSPDCEIIISGDLPVVTAKQLQIWRVFNCLIENAVKYNRSDVPRVEISAELDGGFWRFCVQDNGIGIDAKDQQKVFELFRRLHKESDYPGTGVGLATCRKLVEGWRGRIWVSSAPDKGAAFYFTHPVGLSNQLAA